MVERNLKSSDYLDIANPYANKPKPAPKEKLYEKPDPRQKVDCREDRPIKMNPTGQYNLNFIDFHNEWEAIIDRTNNDTYESPIPGMSNEMYQQIYDESFNDNEQQVANETVLQKLKTKQVVRD